MMNNLSYKELLQKYQYALDDIQALESYLYVYSQSKSIRK